MIEIYTDGSCNPNPGKGGWGAYIVYPDGKTENLHGGQENTTNNQMELMGAIKGLSHFEKKQKIKIYTDSQYVQKGITGWIRQWKKNGWRTANRKPVKNVDLWQQLDSECKKHTITWSWVRGHNGNYGNEKADELAGLYVNGETKKEPELTLAQRVSALEQKFDSILQDYLAEEHF